jgi:hypothetical protein
MPAPGPAESLITQPGEDEATDAARKFIRSYGQQIVDESSPSEADLATLGQAMIMAGDIEQAGKVLSKAVELYPESTKLASIRQTVEVMVEANQSLVDIDTELNGYQEKLSAAGTDCRDRLALTKRLVQSLSDIFTGKTCVIMSYTEGGVRKRGKLWVGPKAVREWVGALRSMGAAVYSDTGDPDDIRGKLVGIEPVAVWPAGLREITEGEFKGAYTKDGKVPTKYGRDMQITVFPCLGFFEAKCQAQHGKQP